MSDLFADKINKPKRKFRLPLSAALWPVSSSPSPNIRPPHLTVATVIRLQFNAEASKVCWNLSRMFTNSERMRSQNKLLLFSCTSISSIWPTQAENNNKIDEGSLDRMVKSLGVTNTFFLKETSFNCRFLCFVYRCAGC